MPVIISLVSGNLAPTYQFTLERNGVVVDLTGISTATLNIKRAKDDTVTATAYSCATSGDTNGLVNYAPLAAHFPSAGRYWGEVKIIHPGTLPEIFNNYINFVVRDDFV